LFQKQKDERKNQKKKEMNMDKIVSDEKTKKKRKKFKQTQRSN